MKNSSEGENFKPNIAHSEFPQQRGGLMICGYEWGFSKADQARKAQFGEPEFDWDIECSYANNHLRYGEEIRSIPYNRRIKKWFAMWGSALDEEDPGDFEKSMIQTNWCNTLSSSMEGDYSRLNDSEQVENFLAHIRHFQPRVLLLMGTQLMPALNQPETLTRFVEIMGACTKPWHSEQKPYAGRRFRIGFQSFERCEVVCLPHPSGTQGLSDNYVALFAREISAIVQAYRQYRGF